MRRRAHSARGSAAAGAAAVPVWLHLAAAALAGSRLPACWLAGWRRALSRYRGTTTCALAGAGIKPKWPLAIITTLTKLLPALAAHSRAGAPTFACAPLICAARQSCQFNWARSRRRPVAWRRLGAVLAGPNRGRELSILCGSSRSYQFLVSARRAIASEIQQVASARSLRAAAASTTAAALRRANYTTATMVTSRLGLASRLGSVVPTQTGDLSREPPASNRPQVAMASRPGPAPPSTTTGTIRGYCSLATGQAPFGATSHLPCSPAPFWPCPRVIYYKITIAPTAISRQPLICNISATCGQSVGRIYLVISASARLPALLGARGARRRPLGGSAATPCTPALYKRPIS